METPEQDLIIKRLYREHIKDSLDSPYLAAEKQEFIDSHFSGMSVPALSLFEFAPAASLVALLIFIFSSSQELLLPVRQTGPGEIQKVVSLAKETDYDEARSTAPVEVKRVSSRKGTAVVFQKIKQDHPITIIWVFPGG